MKLLILAAVTLFTSLAAAGVVITPIRPDQVIPKASDDCFFGVTTPQGCGPARSA
ncbi:secreted protein [Schizothecium vesticola]|uniref:Secreted protein n=1 Tax=Schizothecium vesticola TaxID=314040 RepID=A0AA40F1K3_9PEZI|nr:secreted protein [Schizothecium vesticola]